MLEEKESTLWVIDCRCARLGSSVVMTKAVLAGRPLEQRYQIGGACEAHVPTQCAASVSTAWIPASDDD